MAGAANAGPVVAELFTSNSCSSCPPAYDTLDRLVAAYRDSDTPIIRLDEHVDYWNQLNWVDRYSSAGFTHRQQNYANRVFRDGRIYTPELVIDGRMAMVGSDARPARHAIASLHHATRLLHVTIVHRSAHRVTARIDSPRPAGRLWFALTQDHVVSHIGAGENGGRTLHESGVVRILAPAADEDGHSGSLALPERIDRRDLHVVAFVQDAAHRIVAAGTTPLLAGQTF